MSDTTITILKTIYDQLVDRDFKLSCLESGGVDNWEGYDWAMENYWSQQGDED